MQPTHIIKIAELIDTNLHSRDAAQILFENLDTLQTANKIVLDFSDVIYMSRSFADQFHKEMQKSIALGVVVEVLNCNDHVTEILKAVAKTQNSTNRQRPVLPYIEFANEKDFENYLLAI
jgi:anti-anti-sigma regulatory factor